MTSKAHLSTSSAEKIPKHRRGREGAKAEAQESPTGSIWSFDLNILSPTGGFSFEPSNFLQTLEKKKQPATIKQLMVAVIQESD